MKQLVLLALFTLSRAQDKSVCFVKSSKTYGLESGTFVDDQSTILASGDYTLQHRTVGLKTCVDRSGNFQGVQAILAVPAKKSTTQLRLNSFGKLSGDCDTLTLATGEFINSISIGFLGSGIGEFVVFTDQGNYRTVGNKLNNSTRKKFTFDKFRPFIGLYGYYQSEPTALGVIQYKLECDEFAGQELTEEEVSQLKENPIEIIEVEEEKETVVEDVDSDVGSLPIIIGIVAIIILVILAVVIFAVMRHKRKAEKGIIDKPEHDIELQNETAKGLRETTPSRLEMDSVSETQLQEEREKEQARQKALRKALHSSLTKQRQEYDDKIAAENALRLQRILREKAQREEEARIALSIKIRKEKEEMARKEAERLEKERLEKERQDKIEADKRERERLAKEKADREQAERLERERLAREKAEREEAERLERERQAKEQADRLERQRLEQQRLEAERLAEEQRQRLEAERLAREQAERERVEMLEREKRERVLMTAEETYERKRLAELKRQEKLRLEEQARERKRQAILERQRIEKEKAEALARKKEEQRLARLQAEQEAKQKALRLEEERKAAEAERKRQEREKAELEAKLAEERRLKAIEEARKREEERREREKLRSIELAKKKEETRIQMEQQEKERKEQVERMRQERKEKEIKEQIKREAEAKQKEQQRIELLEKQAEEQKQREIAFKEKQKVLKQQEEERIQRVLKEKAEHAQKQKEIQAEQERIQKEKEKIAAEKAKQEQIEKERKIKERTEQLIKQRELEEQKRKERAQKSLERKKSLMIESFNNNATLMGGTIKPKSSTRVDGSSPNGNQFAMTFKPGTMNSSLTRDRSSPATLNKTMVDQNYNLMFQASQVSHRSPRRDTGKFGNAEEKHQYRNVQRNEDVTIDPGERGKTILTIEEVEINNTIKPKYARNSNQSISGSNVQISRGGVSPFRGNDHQRSQTSLHLLNQQSSANNSPRLNRKESQAKSNFRTNSSITTQRIAEMKSRLEEQKKPKSYTKEQKEVIRASKTMHKQMEENPLKYKKDAMYLKLTYAFETTLNEVKKEAKKVKRGVSASPKKLQLVETTRNDSKMSSVNESKTRKFSAMHRKKASIGSIAEAPTIRGSPRAELSQQFVPESTKNKEPDHAGLPQVQDQDHQQTKDS